MFQAGVKGGLAFSGKGVGAAETLMSGVFRSRGQAPSAHRKLPAETDALRRGRKPGVAQELSRLSACAALRQRKGSVGVLMAQCP